MTTKKIKFDLKCLHCKGPLDKSHDVYKRFPSYAKAKNGERKAFCSKSCGSKFTHANRSDKQKKAYHEKIADSRKSRSNAEKAASAEKLRNTLKSFSVSKKKAINEKRHATELERGVYETQWSRAEATMRQRMGDDYGKQRAAKASKTMKKRYGVSNALVAGSATRKKAEATTKKLYGHKVATKSAVVVKKLVSTYTERHGGMGRASKSAEAAYQNTMLTLYGVVNPSHNKAIKAKNARSYKLNGGKEKAAATKKRNGTTPKEVAHKGHATRKSNGTLNTSKGEKKIHRMLRTLYPKLEFQHAACKGYPWVADFYDPVTNTIFEYQGHVSHGECPFNGRSKEHRNLVAELKKKKDWVSKLTLQIWADRDPKKRKAAKTNGINFVEWFTLSEFEEWFASQILV